MLFVAIELCSCHLLTIVLTLLVELQVVAEANKPEWSGGHRGLQIYLQRLLHPMWDTKLVAPSKASPNSLLPNLTDESLKVY